MPVNYPTHYLLGGTAQDGGLEQNEQELAMLVDFIQKKGVKTYLEIGIAKGDLMRYVESLGVTVAGITLDRMETHKGLRVKYGKSQDAEIIEFMREGIKERGGTIGMIFVDGDHSYEAVKADYENYKGMCRYMAFHDILGLRDCEGVAKLWVELKEKHKTLEFIADERKYASGIGIIYIGKE